MTLYHLYLGIDLDEAIRTKRIHHQLMPMAVQCELGINEVRFSLHGVFEVCDSVGCGYNQIEKCQSTLCAPEGERRLPTLPVNQRVGQHAKHSC